MLWRVLFNNTGAYFDHHQSKQIRIPSPQPSPLYVLLVTIILLSDRSADVSHLIITIINIVIKVEWSAQMSAQKQQDNSDRITG